MENVSQTIEMRTNDHASEARGESRTSQFEAGRYLVPAADIVENADGIRVLLDVPGVSADALDVRLEKNALTIEGRRVEQSREGLIAAHRECHSTGYRRMFTISDAIKRDGITATVKNGVAEIWLPKAEELKPRKIAVRAA